MKKKFESAKAYFKDAAGKKEELEKQEEETKAVEKELEGKISKEDEKEEYDEDEENEDDSEENEDYSDESSDDESSDDEDSDNDNSKDDSPFDTTGEEQNDGDSVNKNTQVSSKVFGARAEIVAFLFVGAEFFLNRYNSKCHPLDCSWVHTPAMTSWRRNIFASL